MIPSGEISVVIHSKVKHFSPAGSLRGNPGLTSSVFGITSGGGIKKMFFSILICTLRFESPKNVRSEFPIDPLQQFKFFGSLRY